MNFGYYKPLVLNSSDGFQNPPLRQYQNRWWQWHDVKSTVEKSIAHFSKIDVVVNNAGYGQTGMLEELTHEEARKNFDANVFSSKNRS